MSEPQRPQPNISVFEGITIIIGLILGAGIFKAPSIVAANSANEAVFLGLWLLGGVLVFAGALCYAELGAAHPHAGGEYHFLTRAYGAPTGLLFAWARCTVIQTGAIAAVAFVYGDYANVLVPLGRYGPSIHAFIIVVMLTAINIRGTVESKQTQIVLTFLEFSAVVAVSVAGLLLSQAAPGTPAPASSGGGNVGLAMVFILLTYGGWNEAAYLSGELSDVRRNMVRVLMLGTAIIVAAYLLINLGYLHALGLDGMKQSSVVAADVMRRAVGDSGAAILAVVVIIAALSTINATIFTGARTSYAVGLDVPLLNALGVWSPRGHNPANALLLQGAISLLLIVLGAVSRDGFEAMVAYTAPVFWLFLFLAGLSLIVFRMREPQRDLPFRVPLYPLPPLILCATSIWMLYSSLVYAGPGALLGVAVLLLGTPLIWVQTRRGRQPQQT
ncbi:MAG: APC family permease [Betaproteobacteria bacterium]